MPKFQQAWGVDLPDRKGLTVVEMMHAVEQDEIKALYIMGENPALSDPNLNRTRKAIEKVDFLVVQDIFLTETAEYADVVLPSTCFAEKDGTFTNTERRVQRVRQAVTAPGEARHDWEILCALAGRMGYPMAYESAAQIMEEIASLTPIYGGISFDRLETTGLQWPCPDRQHPGTKYFAHRPLHEGQGQVPRRHVPESRGNPGGGVPVRLVHRPAALPVPHRHHDAQEPRDPPGLADRVRGGARRRRRAARHRGRPDGGGDHPPGAGDHAGPGDDAASRKAGCSCRSTSAKARPMP